MWLSRGPFARDGLTRRFWWRFHRWETLAAVAAGALVAGAIVVASLSIDESGSCNGRPFECNLISEVLGTLAVGAIGAFVFIWKLRRIVRDFARLARERPQALLGVDMPHQVAGKERWDQLFKVIARDLLHEQPSRARGRAHDIYGDNDRNAPVRPPVPGKLITAGAGAGKTTAMVRLTTFLASRQAVPIPVSLRSHGHPINLVQLARGQFTERVETRTLFGDQGDRTFARLRARGQVVILADGLDEAMPEASRSQREVALSAAIEDALEAGVAVVATSRTPELRRDLPMAQFDLPQLTNKDAVDYLCAEKDDQALRDTIEAAQLNETPFYLTIAERLLQAERLDGWTGDDTTTLRVALLDRYIEALHDERLLPDAELRPGERESVVRELSDVACAMLRRGRASVPLTKIEEWADEEREDQPVDAHTIVGGGRALELFDLVGQETGQFTHSVMQSYLASRRLRQNPARASDLLGDPASNELLTAIVMAAAWRNEGESDLDRRGRGRELADILLKRARERRDSSALALVIAAARIVGACGLGSTLADEVIEHAEECWQQASASTRVAGIVALSELDTRRLFGQILSGALGDADFEVRLAAAKSLGDGGDSAYEALRPKIKRTLDVASNGRLQLEERRELGNYGYVLPLLRRDGGAGHVAEVDKLIEVVEKGVDPRVEATIARGFKRDALRNPSREVDMKRICDLVDKAGWWYSKICLLHALVRRADAGDDVAARRVVESCISNSSEHPFVQEAARQCLTALDVGDVERWIWANESEVVNHARPTRPRAATDADELAVEAVQLAADVALAMNLTFSLEIDPGWDDAERQSQQDARVTAWLRTRELPYCMARSRDRHEVFPDEGVCPRECVHGFCPQKLEGSGSFRTEFSEAFCRQQRDAPPRRGQRPSWQRGFRRRRGLKQFWDRMAEEARHASATRPRTPR